MGHHRRRGDALRRLEGDASRGGAALPPGRTAAPCRGQVGEAGKVPPRPMAGRLRALFSRSHAYSMPAARGWRWWAFTPQFYNGLKRHLADEQLTRPVAGARRPVRNRGLNHLVLLAVQADRRRTGLISMYQGRIQSIWTNSRGGGAAPWRTDTGSQGAPAAMVLRH